MAKKVQFRRLVMLAVLLGVAFAGLGYRLVDLQVLRHENAQAETWTNTHHLYQLEPRRGDIFDARGNLLATSTFVKTVCANPSLLGDRRLELAQVLAPLLDMNPAEVAVRLAPQIRENSKHQTVTNSYVILKRRVSPETWQKIHETMTNFPAGLNLKKLPRKEAAFYQDLRSAGVFVEPVDDQLRTYPNQNLAAHVLGYVGLVERTNAGARYYETAGMEGIERTLNAKLTGVHGWRMTERDGHHHERVDLREEEVQPHDGLNVVLTIDSVLQNILESALGDALVAENPISISGMIVRPKTGEILAMANLPTFNPNDLEASNESARHNRIITDSHEPGSTFKIVVISGGLNENLVQLTDRFDCENGHFKFAGRTLHDSSPHGILSVEEIIMHSSNIGAAKVGILMQQPKVLHYMQEFGFGTRTGVLLPGEVSGIMPPKKWYEVSIAQIPMGQGVSVTSLQLTMAMCAIANHGVLMRPMLLSRLQEQNGNVVARYSPEPVRRVISDAAAQKMVEALKTVVTKEGTAVHAAMEHYTVAGKTGTAQKPPYKENRWYASFVGFFPADNPEVCIYISMDEPKDPHHLHQGGQVCAPVFKVVADKVASYLNVRPDKGLDLPAPVGTGTNALPVIQTAATRAP